ncbi:MAG: ATP-binding protein [Gemmatimonadota bacterium]
MVALMAGVGVPLLLGQGWLLWRERQVLIRSERSNVLNLAEVTAVGARQFLGQAEAGLVGVAGEVGGELLDPERCSRTAVRTRNMIAVVDNVVVADTTGEVICTTLPLPSGASSNILSRSWVQGALADSGFVVGDPQVGRVPGERVLMLAAPLHGRDGGVAGVMGASVRLDRFQERLAGIRSQDDVLVTIVDRNNVVVARSRDPGETVGRVVHVEEFESEEVLPGTWVIVASDLEGTERLWGRAPLPEVGWKVLAGVPTDKARALVLANLYRVGGVLALVLALAVILSWRTYRSISRPFRKVIQSLAGEGGAEGVEVPAGAPTELVELVERLDTAITRMREAREAERRSRERYQSIFDNAVFGIYVSTPEGCFKEVNQALVEMLGYDSAEELLAVGLRDLYVDPDLRAELVASHGGGRAFLDLEVMWKRKDGTPLVVRMNGRSIRTEDGSEAFEVFVVDVTEERRRDQELRRHQKMEAVSRLAGGIAHDFNNLLTVIAGNAGLIESSLSSRDPLRRELDQITEAAERGTELTRKLLSFSRKEAGGTEMVDINDLVAGVEPLLARVLREDISLEVRLERGLPPVTADRAQLEQILLNLVINARDAVEDHGRIRIETLTVEDDGLWVAFRVTDDGKGMDEETQSRVFEPFFTTKEEHEGSGLGLANAFHTVHLFGGTIRVDTEPGEGTSVTVLLPPAEDSALAAEEHGERTAAAPVTILVAEDKPEIRDLVRRALEREGYEVHLADDGREALKAIRDAPHLFDLVVTDIRMPRLSGAGLAEAVRETHGNLPFLFISAYPDDEEFIKIQSEDPGIVLAKPFKPHELLRRVEELLHEPAPTLRNPMNQPDRPPSHPATASLAVTRTGS